MKRCYVFYIVWAFVLALSSAALAMNFGLFSVKVPSDYAVSSNTSIPCYIYEENYPNVFMFIDVEEKTSSLSAHANYLCKNFGGSHVYKDSDYGYYYFTYHTNDGTFATMFIDDSSTDSHIKSGYYRFASKSIYFDKDDFNSIINTFRQRSSSSGGGSGGGGGYNKDNYDYDDYYDNDDDDDDYCCNTGMSAFAVFASFMVFLKKSR